MIAKFFKRDSTVRGFEGFCLPLIVLFYKLVEIGRLRI